MDNPYVLEEFRDLPGFTAEDISEALKDFPFQYQFPSREDVLYRLENGVVPDKYRVPVVESFLYICNEDLCGYLEDSVAFQLFKNRDETYELKLGDKTYNSLSGMTVKVPETSPMWESYINRRMKRGQALILEVTYNDGETDTILLAFSKKAYTYSFLKQLSSPELDTLVNLDTHIGEIALLRSKDVLPQSKTSDFLQFNSPFGTKKRGGGRKKNKTKKKRNKSKKKSKKRRKSKSK